MKEFDAEKDCREMKMLFDIKKLATELYNGGDFGRHEKLIRKILFSFIRATELMTDLILIRDDEN